MLPEELLWVIALDSIPAYYAMVTAIPQLARKITLGTQCNHKIHFGYDVKVVNRFEDACIIWYYCGNMHRTDGPAIDYVNGDKEYWLNDKRHRINGPAIEWADGGKEYYFNGNLHRTDGPAIEYINGRKEYFQDGKRHRTDGPATEHVNGYKAYYLNDNLHRVDGPAIERANGSSEYYLDGIKYTLQNYILRAANY